MRIFMITADSELELYDGDRLIGVYAPGLRYTCQDDNKPLAEVLAEWIAQGKARVIEHRGTVAGHGTVE